MRHRRPFLARAVFFYAAFFIFELTLRAGCALPLEFPVLLHIAAFSLAPVLVCSVFCGCFGERGGVWVQGVLTVVIALLYGAQIVYHTVFGVFFTTYSLLNGARALQFVDVIFSAIRKQVPAALILLGVVGMFVFFARRGTFSAPRRRLRGQIRTLLVAVALQCVAVALLFCTGFTPQGAFAHYFCKNDATAAVSRLGLYTAMRLDVQRYAFGFTPIGEALLKTQQASLGAYDAEDAADKSDGDESKPVRPQSETGEPQILPIDWDTFQAQETNPELQAMDAWFSQRTPTYTNNMTGLFEGKNLIFLTAEAFSPLAVDKDRTPTLYKIMQEGYQFVNYYTPLWGVSTLDGEYVNLQGLLPKNGVWSMLESARNVLPFTLGNQFSALGYKTLAYHNHTYDYYERDLSHPNLGYTYQGYGNGLDVTWQWPESDVEMVDITTKEYLDGTPFHVYYLTVSGHLAYNFMGGNAMATKHEEAVADLPYSDAVRAYLACQMELDRALELLLERLEEAGELADTVIALAPDHYPYGLTQQEIDELAGHAVGTEFELYKNSFLLYNAGTTDGRVITRPCSNLDILPTLSNLFGLPFDSRLLMGTDMFSDAPPLVVFATRSWVTDQAKYNANTNTLIPLTRTDLPEGYFESVNTRANDLFTYSEKILTKNYYARVLPAQSD